jgi:hypothetical protein
LAGANRRSLVATRGLLARDARLRGLPLPALRLSTSAHLTLSRRDRRILELARAKLHGSHIEFSEAMRALREAAEELIPDGRVFLLGAADVGPIVGSIVSGVGIRECVSGIQLVRVQGSGEFAPIGWFSR